MMKRTRIALNSLADDSELSTVCVVSDGSVLYETATVRGRRVEPIRKFDSEASALAYHVAYVGEDARRSRMSADDRNAEDSDADAVWAAAHGA